MITLTLKQQPNVPLEAESLSPDVLAALSLDFRREVAIVVTEPAAVAVAIELFQSVRDTMTSGEPAAGGRKGEAAC